jgi:hypothetical protein
MGPPTDRAAASQDMTSGELKRTVSKPNLRSKLVVPIVGPVDEPAVGVARNLQHLNPFVTGIDISDVDDAT